MDPAILKIPGTFKPGESPDFQPKIGMFEVVLLEFLEFSKMARLGPPRDAGRSRRGKGPSGWICPERKTGPNPHPVIEEYF